MQAIDDDPGITQQWTAVVVIPTSINFAPQTLAIVNLCSSEERNAQSERVVTTVSITLDAILPIRLVMKSSYVYQLWSVYMI